MIRFITNCKDIPHIKINDKYYVFNTSILELRDRDCICTPPKNVNKLLKYREAYLINDMGYICWIILVITDLAVIRVIFFQEYFVVYLAPQSQYDMWLVDTQTIYEGKLLQYDQILNNVSTANHKDMKLLFQWLIQSHLNKKYMPIYNYYCEISLYQEGL